VLSRGEPCDGAVNFDTYRILRRHRALSLPLHDFLVGLCLQPAVNYLSKSDKYLKELVRSQTSNHISLSITAIVIIYRQRSLMVTINRTRKDGCNNACVLLPLIHSHGHGVQSDAANVRWKQEQSPATPQCTPTLLNKQHAWNYCISPRHRLFHANFGGVLVGPDRPCWASARLKLFGREITFEEFQPILWSQYTERHG